MFGRANLAFGRPLQAIIRLVPINADPGHAIKREMDCLQVIPAAIRQRVGQLAVGNPGAKRCKLQTYSGSGLPFADKPRQKWRVPHRFSSAFCLNVRHAAFPVVFAAMRCHCATSSLLKNGRRPLQIRFLCPEERGTERRRLQSSGLANCSTSRAFRRG
jgi:hypothetical protein